MAQNSGVYDVSLLLNQIERSKNGGFDFRTMQFQEDMIKAGIIDPVLVIKQAIQNAVSVAGSIITTEVAMVEEPKKNEGSGNKMTDDVDMM
jgi:Chaperonin GroEL (HSP60 family)